MVRVFAYILKVKGSNLTNGVFVVNSDKLTKYLCPLQFIIICAYLGCLHGLCYLG
jgi:hypothetical protein